jgi:lipopolysaccharide/colanic/teichoic acid biosynthesis glycosyltransferase
MGYTRVSVGQEQAGPAKSDVRDPKVVLAEAAFRRAVYLEQRRSERSKRGFVLMLACPEDADSADRDRVFSSLIKTLVSSVRETDHIGWHRAGTSLGAIFPEVEGPDHQKNAKPLMDRMAAIIAGALTPEQIEKLHLSFHIFPEHWENGGGEDATSTVLYSDSPTGAVGGRAELLAKRALDLVGGLALCLLLLPLMGVVAILIKTTSPGPVFFRQQRVGRYGRRFTFLKFRSMVTSNDPAVHREYMERFITGKQESSVYKMTDDARVTPIGRFLRKTSIDELPQLFNVLAGDMSLVGPRPPIPYEVDCYEVWHRRRLLHVKPGITGLWQVSARSKVGFDDMVRLDLQYVRTWSLWLDIKILLKTPSVVLAGYGAY